MRFISRALKEHYVSDVGEFSPIPSFPTLVLQSEEIEIDGFVESRTKLVPLEDVDQRPAFVARDFSLRSMIASGAIDGLTPQKPLTPDVMTANDKFTAGVKACDNIIIEEAAKLKPIKD